MVENQGFEPRMPEATDLQSAEVTNASRSPTGSPRWVRTTDLRINSPSLYRLSYQGIIKLWQVRYPLLGLVPFASHSPFTFLTTKLGADYRIRTDDLSLTRRLHYHCAKSANWSEYKDSNFGPPGPKPGALPDCATLRCMVEVTGIEPATYCLQSSRSPN